MNSVIRKCALGLVVVGVAIFGLAWHQGIRLYVVETGSMSPTFEPGDVVVDKPVSAGYRPGDVLTFQISSAGDLVTHRFKRTDKVGLIHTKGDANETPDAWALRPEQVRGVVTSHVPNLGYVIVFMRQPAGIGGIMTSTLAIFLLWGLCFPAQAEPTREKKKQRTPVRIPQQQPAPVSGPAMVPARVQPAVLRIPSRRIPQQRPAPVSSPALVPASLQPAEIRIPPPRPASLHRAPERHNLPA